jgi:hypothetical protein
VVNWWVAWSKAALVASFVEDLSNDPPSVSIMHRIHACRDAGRCRLRFINITVKQAVTSNDLLPNLTSRRSLPPKASSPLLKMLSRDENIADRALF